MIVFNYLIRTIISFILTKVLFRLKYSFKNPISVGKKYIFVSNFSSCAVIIFIRAAYKSKIKFVIREGIFPRSFPYKFFTNMVIEKPDEFNVKENERYQNEAHNLISKGYSLCFFPEKKISRNNIINKFYDEFTDITSKYPELEIVPLYTGSLWGSFLSPVKLYSDSKRRFINVFFGETLSNETALWELRKRVVELAADSEMSPRAGEKVLHYRFMKIAKEKPFKKLISEYNGKALNRFQILYKSLILRRIIRKAGNFSKYIGVMLPNSNACAVTLMSLLYADKTPCVLNFSLSHFTITSLINTYNLDAVITSRKFIDKIKFEKIPEMIFLEDIVKKVTLYDKIITFLILLLPAYISIKILSPYTYNNVYSEAVVIFSSGSTGNPNGIVLTHRNLNADSGMCCDTMVIKTERDAITGNLPLFHSYGMLVEFWIPFRTGIRVTYIANPLEYENTVKAIKKDKLTLLASTQTFLFGYLKKATKDDFSSLRLLIVGAEKYNNANTNTILEKTNVEPIEGYGCTELSPVVSINISDDVLEDSIKPGKPESIGRALTGIAVKIVDVETRKELSPNNQGLLLIKGPTVMKGYLDRPEETLDAVAGGWYNTKDIAFMDEAGFITMIGRISRFSKISGEMVSHECIETLISTYLGLMEKSIAVVNLKDNKGSDRVGVLYSKADINIEDIVHYLSEYGLSRLWIPKPRDFIKVDEIPTLPSGKLDLQKLREMAAAVSKK